MIKGKEGGGGGGGMRSARPPPVCFGHISILFNVKVLRPRGTVEILAIPPPPSFCC